MTRWLAPLMIVRGFTHFPLNALMGLGHTLARLWCIVASATVAMVLYITLVPSMSWKGAVIGSYFGGWAAFVHDGRHSTTVWKSGLSVKLLKNS